MSFSTKFELTSLGKIKKKTLRIFIISIKKSSNKIGDVILAEKLFFKLDP